MSDSTTTPSNPDNARLEKLEGTVRRLRRWLWVALIIGIAFFSFAIGRISGSKAQMNRGQGMPGNQMPGNQMQGPNFNMQGPPPQQMQRGGPQGDGKGKGKGKNKDDND
ncbi:MAG: hypothetical protein EBY29_12950 [Planctomycetes bacterium]|nr:hypothetical protein [Planctomycetota bacterium]